MYNERLRTRVQRRVRSWVRAPGTDVMASWRVPLAVVLMRGVDNIPLALAIAPAIVVIAAQIAASLAWITMSGEDAPELIPAAPVRRAPVDRAKVPALGVPGRFIRGLPFSGLALLSPLLGLQGASS